MLQYYSRIERPRPWNSTDKNSVSVSFRVFCGDEGSFQIKINPKM